MMKFAENNICSRTVEYPGEAAEVHDGAGGRNEKSGENNTLLDHLTLIHIGIDHNESGLHCQENEAGCSVSVHFGMQAYMSLWPAVSNIRLDRTT